MKKKWVKLVLASSIDGRIAYPEGGKTQLGQSGDRLVLEESLAWSDGILMGGQTLRDHQSICVIKNKSLLKKRISEGKDEQPIALIASNQIDFPENWLFRIFKIFSRSFLSSMVTVLIKSLVRIIS